MSLINDMLKNLEKRFDGAKNVFHAQPVELQEEESIAFKAFLWVFALLILSAIVWFSIRFYRHHHEKESNTSHAAPAAISVGGGATTAGPKPVVPPPPKLVTGIQVNDLPERTDLSIALNAAPTYLTSTDPTTNTLTLTLQNTYLTMSKICAQLGNPPNCASGNTIPLPSTGTAISNIQVQQNDGQSLVLNIKLAPNAALGGSQLILNPTRLKLTIDKNSAQNTSGATNISNGNDNTSSNDQVDNGPVDDPNAMLQPVKQEMKLASNNPIERISQAVTQHDFDRAQHLYDALPASVKTSTEGSMAQAKIYLGEGKNTEALAVLKAVPFDGQSASFYAIYAATLEFNKQHAQAVDIYKRLINYWPDNVNWWLGLGISAYNDKENALASYAFHHLDSVANLNPEIQSFVQAKLEDLSIDDHPHVETVESNGN